MKYTTSTLQALVGKTISEITHLEDQNELIIKTSDNHNFKLAYNSHWNEVEVEIEVAEPPKKLSFSEMMMERGDLVRITEDWRGKGMIPKGALIGFVAFPDKPDLITAAYPFWREVNNQVQFVLFMPGRCTWTDNAVMDNDYFTSDNLYINKEPVIVEVDDSYFNTFGQAVGAMFGK